MCKSQADRIEDHLHPLDGHPKVIAMFHGYLDESGIHEGAPICLIAGYFGGPGQWRKFVSQWQRILDRYAIEEFHAREFWGFDEKAHRVGPYKNWEEVKAKDFLRELVAVISGHRRKIHPTVSVVVVDAFNKRSHEERKFLTGAELENGKFTTSGCPSKAYFLPFQTCITDVASHAPIGGKAHFFFDLNKQFKGYALELFAYLKSLKGLRVQDRIGRIDFPTGLDAVQLQSADLLAYQFYQYAQERITNRKAKASELLNKLMMGWWPDSDTFFDDEGIQLLLKDAQFKK